jgi:hypothetical protein
MLRFVSLDTAIYIVIGEKPEVKLLNIFQQE